MKKCLDIPGILDFLDETGNSWVEPWVSDEDKEKAGGELGDLLILIAELGFNLGYGRAYEDSKEETKTLKALETSSD